MPMAGSVMVEVPPCVRRDVIAEALRAGLHGLPGRWRLHAQACHWGNAWLVDVIRRDDGFHRVLFLEEPEARPPSSLTTDIEGAVAEVRELVPAGGSS